MKDPTVIRWSKLGPQLAIGTAKGNLVLYNRDSRKLTPVQGKHSKRITCADWSTSTNVLALGGQDNVMTIRCARCYYLHISAPLRLYVFQLRVRLAALCCCAVLSFATLPIRTACACIRCLCMHVRSMFCCLCLHVFAAMRLVRQLRTLS